MKSLITWLNEAKTPDTIADLADRFDTTHTIKINKLKIEFNHNADFRKYLNIKWAERLNMFVKLEEILKKLKIKTLLKYKFLLVYNNVDKQFSHGTFCICQKNKSGQYVDNRGWLIYDSKKKTFFYLDHHAKTKIYDISEIQKRIDAIEHDDLEYFGDEWQG